MLRWLPASRVIRVCFCFIMLFFILLVVFFLCRSSHLEGSVSRLRCKVTENFRNHQTNGDVACEKVLRNRLVDESRFGPVEIQPIALVLVIEQQGSSQLEPDT